MNEKIQRLLDLLKKHNARRVEIFGSYARGEAGEKSDIDVIVDFAEKKSLLEIIGIEQELEDELGVKVDLLTRKSISPYLIKEIEKESKVILDGKA